jgi:cathepsin L
MLVVVIGGTLLSASQPVDWNKREKEAPAGVRQHLADLRKHIQDHKWDFRVGHTAVVEHNFRSKRPTFVNRWNNVAFTNQIERVNRRAGVLLQIDNEARRSFVQAHPGVLPVVKPPSPKLPAFDWSERVNLGEQHHQLCGESWATAVVEALELSDRLWNGEVIHASVQPLLDFIPEKDMKGQSLIAVACEFLLKHGTAPIKEYAETGKPGQPRKQAAFPYQAVVWGYVNSGDGAPSVEHLKKALAQHGPLVVSMYSTPPFEAYAGGTFNQHHVPKKEEGYGNHAVLLVGWDDAKKAWKVRNCWGNEWGENGYGWVAYGSNNIGHEAVWLRARSRRVKLPAEYEKKLQSSANSTAPEDSPRRPIRDDRTRVAADPTPPKPGEPSPTGHYRLISEIAREAEWTVTAEAHHPNYTVEEWLVIAPRPPELPNQPKVSARMVARTPGGAAVEAKPEGHWLVARVPGHGGHRLEVELHYHALLAYRQLVPLAEGATPPKVAPLSPEVRRHNLMAQDDVDYEAPAFQHWLTQHDLRRRPGESEIDFARRAFLFISTWLRYTTELDHNSRASHVVQTHKSECGRTSKVFVATMRANGIPARYLVGRMADMEKNKEGKLEVPGHAKSEFFAAGVGWVPVEQTGALTGPGQPPHPPEKILHWFGSFQADHLTMSLLGHHTLNIPPFGQIRVGELQGILIQAHGKGSGERYTEVQHWKVQSKKLERKAK